MKTALFATALLAASLFATNEPVASAPGPVDGPGRHGDSGKIAPLPGPAHQLPSLPDSVKAKIEQQAEAFEARKEQIRRDSAKGPENRVVLDSLRKAWEAKRDTQVAHIPDSATRAKVEARIHKIAEHKAAVKAKVEAKKEEIEARKAKRQVPPSPAP